MSRIKLDNVDLAWLRMHQVKNPMMITVIVQLSGQTSYDAMVTLVNELFTRYRRFRQRIVIPEGVFKRPYWEDAPDLGVENHLRRAQIRLPVDKSAVEELVNREMNTPLDFAHPLWRLTFVDSHPEGSILILCIHHCIADGISLMRVLLQMTSSAPVVPSAHVTPENVNSKEQIGNVTPTYTQRTQPPDPAISQSRASSPVLRRKPNVFDLIGAVLRILFLWPDPHTMFKGKLGGVKKAVWSEPFCITDLKVIARSKHATVNDVLMAITAGAIRKYFNLRGDRRPLKLRTIILVNMRGHAVDDDLGNQFGLVFLNLPVDREKSLDRLQTIKQGMDFLKASAEYSATYLILQILGMLPAWVEKLAVAFFDTKGSVVATNVPGPRHTLYLGGVPISYIEAWVPQSGRIGVGFSFISYNGFISIGVNTDTDLVPDPEKLIQLFTEEYNDLQEAVSIESQKNAGEVTVNTSVSPDLTKPN